MKISIVVPIYNIENYVRECIESILKQSFTEFELILVDDGSTDNSSKIIDEYIKHPNIRIFHKKNGGLSDARNFGINKANGEYIMFVDGDDYLYNNNCLNKIYEKVTINPSADVIQYKMIYFYNRQQKYLEMNSIPNINGKTLDILDELNITSQISISACDKIIKRTILIDNKIFFEKGIYSEDIEWSLNLYDKINTISLLDENIYVYRQQRAGSITTTKSSKSSKDLFNIILKWYNQKYTDPLKKEIYYNFLAYQLLILLTISDMKIFSNKEKEQIKFLEKKLLFYDKNYKVKLYNKVRNIFGRTITKTILKVYNKLKNTGLFKI